MSPKKEKLIDRIRKLKLHAESAEEIGSQAEAEAFAKAASRLMKKHRIELSDLELEEFQKNDPLDVTIVTADAWGMKPSSRKTKWPAIMASAVATSHMCKIIWWGHYHEGKSVSNSLAFAGRQSDREVARYIFLTLMQIRASLGSKLYREMKSDGKSTKGFWSSYNLGFVQGVAEALKEDDEAFKLTSDSKALARVSDALAETENWVSKELNLRSTTGYSGKARHSGAYFAGRNDGASNANVKGNPNSKKLN